MSGLELLDEERWRLGVFEVELENGFDELREFGFLDVFGVEVT